MAEDIRIGVASEAVGVRDVHTAEDEWAVFCELVDVVAGADHLNFKVQVSNFKEEMRTGVRVVLEDFFYRDFAVGGDDGIGIRFSGFLGEGDFSSCGFDEELAGGDVPERDGGFDVGIESAAGNVGHAECGGAHHAHFAGAEGGFVESLDSGVEGFGVFSATDEEDGFFEFFARRNFNRDSVQHGLAAFYDGPGFADHGIVDDTEHDFVADTKGDGDAEVWDAVEEIHCAIDGIDDPLAVGVLVSSDTFLAVERVGGATVEEDVGDEVLGFLVEREFDVVMMCFIDRERLAEMFAQEFSCFKSGLDGQVEIVFHGLWVMF